MSGVLESRRGRPHHSGSGHLRTGPDAWLTQVRRSAADRLQACHLGTLGVLASVAKRLFPCSWRRQHATDVKPRPQGEDQPPQIRRVAMTSIELFQSVQ